MYEYRAKVVNVIDGDTLRVWVDLGFETFVNAKVRLLGINCPETRTKDLAEKELGFKAKDEVKRLLPEGTPIIIKTQLDKTDSFSRYLAIVYIGDLNLNDYLLKEGFAKEYVK